MQPTSLKTPVIIVHLISSLPAYSRDLFFNIIFGSSITNKARPESDIDIAFLGKDRPRGTDIFNSAQHLSYRLKKDIDLIDLNQVSPVMQVQILQKGRVIYDKEPSLRKEFFMLALKKYTRLNEERKAIIEKIQERGQVYGG